MDTADHGRRPMRLNRSYEYAHADAEADLARVMEPEANSGHANSKMPLASLHSNATENYSIPIKLTPITGRVSRAKKGIPVYTCDICKPPKVPKQ
jgi:hypothetical protein